tara:strand:+ start:51 stop:362 length:312 start_codon:yes stop_codon:yes gene_type:complete
MANDNFKEIPESEWFELDEGQVCVVALNNLEEQVFAGYFEEPEEEDGTFDLQGCYEFDGLKEWFRASGHEQGMSYCGLDVDTIQSVFVPKKDVDLDACMKLWS